MKLSVFLLIICLFSFQRINAQSLSWFHGTWYGETYFPNAPITKRIIIRLRVTNVTGNDFTATMANLYPNDTTVRLEREVKGKIIKKQMVITSSEETYILDPRTRNFWYDCTSCALQSPFSITDNNVQIKLTTTNCGDICNGETVFNRDTSSFDSSSKIALAKWLGLPAKQTIAKAAQSNKDTIKIAMQKPEKKDSAVAVNVPKKQVVNPSVKPLKQDSVKVSPAAKRAVLKDTVAAMPKVSHDTLPDVLTGRNTNLINTYQVTSPHIIVQLYDNAEIDGDMVSVYHNGKLIIDHQTLTHKAITFTLDASLADAHHEFIMIAENLGLTPPNTALMRITAGDQKFELEVASDLDNNAKISIDYTGK